MTTTLSIIDTLLRSGISFPALPPKAFLNPTFEFGLLPHSWDEQEMYWQALDEACQALDEGRFSLPFPQVWYTEVRTAPDGRQMRIAMFAEAIEGGVRLHVVFGHPTLPKWTLWAEHFEIFDSEYFHSIGDPDDPNLALIKHGETDGPVRDLLVLTALLMRPGTVTEKIIPSEKLQAHNQLRRQRGLPALPVVHRVIQLDHEGASYRGVSSGLGNPKRPHDRRGHARTLKSGKVVTVRACAIHGGGHRTHYRVLQ